MLESLKNIVFPDLCVACRVRRPTVDEELCRSCLSHLPFIQLPEDAKAALAGKDQFPSEVSSFYSLFYYTKESYVAELIHYIKYDGLHDIGRYLGGLLWRRQLSLLRLDKHVLVPVPIHPKKRKRRGYNQAEEIAKGISQESGLPIIPDLLIRTSDTSSQTKKDQADRTKVLEHAFDLNPSYDSQLGKILLIDDVVTTGSTIAACTSNLLKGRPEEIAVATLGVSI